jgi:hypothetical protein
MAGPRTITAAGLLPDDVRLVVTMVGLAAPSDWRHDRRSRKTKALLSVPGRRRFGSQISLTQTPRCCRT